MDGVRRVYATGDVLDLADGCFDYKSLSDYLTLGEATLRRMVAKGEIPHAKIGRRVVFPRSAIYLWLTESMSASMLGKAQS